MQVVVAVLTFRRVDAVRALLPVLDREAIEASGSGHDVRIVVVDNDPAASAASAVADAAKQSRTPVVYCHEPEPGISAGRNRALSEAGDASLLAFIDDDERPVEGWLVNLLSARARHQCAAVLGPVVPEYKAVPSEWLRASGHFERPRRPSGTLMAAGYSGNLLLDLDAIRSWGLHFEAAFGLSGGEDVLFTRSILKAGGQIVWCDEAPVIDVVPAERMSRRWVLLRKFSSGNTSSLVEIALESQAWTRVARRLVLFIGGLARSASGVGVYILGLLTRSLPRKATGMRLMCRGAGMASGAVGYRYQEYRRPTG